MTAVERYQDEWLKELLTRGHKVEHVTAGYPAWALRKKTWALKRMTVHQALAEIARAQHRSLKRGILKYEPIPSNVIDEGSGIVGKPVDQDHVLVFFEGNRFGAENIVTFADRCDHAADRMLWNDGKGYPTIAKGVYACEDLNVVGFYDTETGVVTCDDSEKLSAWLGREYLEHPEEPELKATRPIPPMHVQAAMARDAARRA